MMADIKVNNTSVFTPASDGTQLRNITGTTACTYTDWQPSAAAVTTANVLSVSSYSINMDEEPLESLSLAQAVSFTLNTSSLTSGVQKTKIILLDTTTTPHTPTFSSDFIFADGTPTWTQHRHWLINCIQWFGSGNDQVVRCTAVGYDDPGSAPSTGLDSTFSLSGWSPQGSVLQSFGEPEAWGYVHFQRDDSNNRIVVYYAHGTSQAPGTYNTSYCNYSGLTNITSIEAKYYAQNGTCTGTCNPSDYTFGPLPTSDGYSSDTYYTVPSTGRLEFEWMAKRANQSTGSTYVEAILGDPSNSKFTIKVVCDQGTLTSTVGGGGGFVPNVYLSASYGTVQAR